MRLAPYTDSDQKGIAREWDTTKTENSFLDEKVESILNDMEKIQTAIEHLQFDIDFLGSAYNLGEYEDLRQVSKEVKAYLVDSHDKITSTINCMEKFESKLYEKGWLHKNGGKNDGR